QDRETDETHHRTSGTKTSHEPSCVVSKALQCIRSCSTTSVSGDCDYCEQSAQDSHVDIQAGSNTLRICFFSSLVSLRVQRRCECEDQSYNVLTECSEDHAGTQSLVCRHV